MKNIVFIGFMGSGKTTIGRALAKEIYYEFIDTDQWISDKMNLTVGEIFASKGEEYFRQLETSTVKLFSNELENTVLSTGGGLSIRQENASYLKEIGTVVYLKASKNTILGRLNPNIERPLLAGPNPEERIEELLKQRNPIYEEVADLIIDTDDKSVETIVKELKERLWSR